MYIHIYVPVPGPDPPPPSTERITKPPPATGGGVGGRGGEGLIQIGGVLLSSRYFKSMWASCCL